MVCSGKKTSDISGYIATTSAVTLRKSQCHWSIMTRKSHEILRDSPVGFHMNYIASAMENNYSQTWSCLGEWNTEGHVRISAIVHDSMLLTMHDRGTQGTTGHDRAHDRAR